MNRMENPQQECNYRKLDFMGSNLSDLLIRVEHRDSGELCVLKSLGSDFTGPSNPIEIVISTSVRSNRVANSVDIIDGRLCDLPGVALVNKQADNDMFDHIFGGKQVVTYDERLRLVYDTLLGVKTMHDRGYVHLDIKMENVLVKDGRGYLTDFGFARKCINNDDRLHIGRDDGVSATRIFIAPELVDTSGPRFYSYATDIWSLGHLIYSAITGAYLFDNDIFGSTDDFDQQCQNLLGYLYNIRPGMRLIDRYDFDKKIPLKDRMNMIMILEQCTNLDPTKRGNVDTILDYDIFNRFKDETLIYYQPELAFRIVNNPTNYDFNLKGIDYLIVNNFGDESCYLLFLAIDLYHRCVPHTGYNESTMVKLEAVCVWIALKCINTRSPDTLIQILEYYDLKSSDAQFCANMETHIYVALKGNISPDYLYEACEYGEQLMVLHRNVILNTANYGYSIDRYGIGNIVINNPDVGKELLCYQFKRD